MGTVYAKVEHKYNFGEDEAGLFDFEEPVLEEDPVLPKMIVALSAVKARVDRVNVDGLSRTKDDVIRGTVDDLFQAQDFEDVIVRAHKVREALDNLGCFGRVCVFIDVSSGPDATPDGLEVTFQVRELARVVGNFNTSVGEDEGSVVLGVKLPNLFGRGERAQAAYSLGYLGTTNFNLTATKPILFQPYSPVISGTIYQQNREYPWSGYRVLDRGVLLEAGIRTSPNTRHSLQWEGILRDLTVLNKTAFKIRESSGPVMKSMVRHVVNVDLRDEPVFPSRGAWLQFSNELAGLGGSVAAFKTELHAQANFTIDEQAGVVVQATGALGLLHDVFGTTLADHFYLGGATSLRGFQTRGVGPHSDGQAIGGRVYWASGVHIYTPLPELGGMGISRLFRTHLFVNAGCVALSGQQTTLRIERQAQWNSRETLAAISAARVACGVGLCVKIGRTARLEFNYVLPLCTEPTDRVVNGLQFGVGANFL